MATRTSNHLSRLGVHSPAFPLSNSAIPLCTFSGPQSSLDFDELWMAISGLPGNEYQFEKRWETIRSLADRLERHVPAIEGLGQVDPQDILNAGWLVRTRGPETALPGDRADMLVLDNLVGKALDSLKFFEMWGTQESRQQVLSRPESPAGRPEPVIPVGAVLSATEIDRRLDHGLNDVALSTHTGLVVTPRLPGAAQGTGLDVRLSTKFIIFRRSSTSTFDALDQRQHPRDMQEWVEKEWGGQFILHPGELVLAATLEYLVMPDDLTAQVITRSSYGRLGLLTATAVQVHPNFVGCLTLELVNLGQMPLALSPGERIAQLVFQTVYPTCRHLRTEIRVPGRTAVLAN